MKRMVEEWHEAFLNRERNRVLLVVRLRRVLADDPVFFQKIADVFAVDAGLSSRFGDVVIVAP